MRYIQYILTLLLALLLFSCKQEVSPVQAERFIKFYGDAMMDVAGDVEVLGDGGYVFCGTDSVSGEGKRAVLIVTDEYGNMKPGFPQYYSDGNNPSGANALVVKSDGDGFLLAGFVERSIGGGSIQKDLFLVSTSGTGKELWKRRYGSTEDESVLHATEMISSDGFLLAGYQVKEGRKDIMVMGVEANGDSLSLGLNYNNPNADNAAATYICNTGEQYLCVCTYDQTGVDGTKILVLNFDDGLSPTAKILGGQTDELGRCIIRDEADRYLVLGNRMNLSGHTESVVYSINIDGLLITGGSLVTDHPISEINADLVAKRFIKSSEGRIAMVGTRSAEGGSDIFLQFIAPDFRLADRILFGASGAQSGADIELPADGGLLILGTNGTKKSSMISLIRTGDNGEL
ncbi:MAG: hypothetical protein ABFS10_06980 [Bacteroidota bacterium]